MEKRSIPGQINLENLYCPVDPDTINILPTVDVVLTTSNGILVRRIYGKGLMFLSKYNINLYRFKEYFF